MKLLGYIEMTAILIFGLIVGICNIKADLLIGSGKFGGLTNVLQPQSRR